jgi:hypothetical protein
MPDARTFRQVRHGEREDPRGAVDGDVVERALGGARKRERQQRP